MRNKLHPLTIFSHSYKLSLANIIGYAMQIPVSLYVASKLGPENYGLVAFIMLWAFYARLIRPGLIASASREMPHYVGKEQISTAVSIQNICLTYEFIYYVFISVIIIIASVFFKNNVIKVGLILVSVSLLIDYVDCAYWNAQWAFQRFNIITRMNWIKAMITPILTFFLVYLLHVYGLLVLPLAVSIISIICFLFLSPKLHFTITFNFKKLIPLLKVGIALQFLTFLFWAFRGIDKTIVAIYFSKEQLGYYALGIAFIYNIFRIISDFGNVLNPVILSELGRTGDYVLIRREIQQLIIILMAIGCIITNAVQAGFGAMVYWFIPKFIPSIKIFEIFSFAIIFTAILLVPFNILLSPLINKQKLCNYIYGTAVLIIILLAYLIVKMGGGIMSIVYLFVGVQVIITSAILFASKKYLFGNKRDSLLFCLLMLALTSITVVNYLIFSIGAFTYNQGHILSPFINRICYALGFWGIAGYIMFRLFTKDKNLIRLIRGKIACAE